jgi:hypothetical protein
VEPGAPFDGRRVSHLGLPAGERRASAVKGYLTSPGVAGNRMRTVSYGS